MNTDILVAVLAALITCHVLFLLIDLVNLLLLLKQQTGERGVSHLKKCEKRDRSVW